MTSIIKVNNLQNQCGANIANKCGTTITLGASGDTITLACGASQTGFGRTGTVDWNTTAITADPANAVSGTGYFANTTSAAFTITLPTSPSAGDIVAVRDYAQTFATNNLTIGRNGQPIDGLSNDLTLDTNGAAVTLVYVDGTQGWKSVNSNETINEIKYITATGGTVTCCGDYKIHTFTSPGTFTVTCAGNPLGSALVDYLVVAGGGGAGGGQGTGGGGAGGYRESSGAASGSYTTSPLGACVSALPVSVQGYPITVGGGGAATPGGGENGRGCNGANSIFSTITSAGGGGGGSGGGGAEPSGSNGGSGGAGGGRGNSAAGNGNTPPVSPPQGSSGGNSAPSANPPSVDSGGGGGGATAVGTAGTDSSAGGAGGAGATSSINATPTARAGGGGGGSESGGASSGGSGGGGAGGGGPLCNGTNGTGNTGGGGGGKGVDDRDGGNGGSGIVIIRYKFQ
jgi:hypothetical protein